MSVIRVVHNQENPFVQLNKRALWNENLSLKATGLWARCMSRPDNWRFNVKELINKCKEGRRAVDAAIKELIDESYALRLEHWGKSENGRFNEKKIEYVFFEFPATQEDKEKVLEEFKKSFRHCCFGNVRNGDIQNDDLPIKKETNIEKKEPPPTPPRRYSIKSVTPLSRKKEEWRRFFSDWKEEEFEYAWSEYEKMPPGHVKSIKAWLPVPRQRFLEKGDAKAVSERNKKEEVDRFRKHHKQALEYAGKQWKEYKVSTGAECVYFANERGGFSVGYTVSDPDWEMQTGWKPWKS